MACCALERLHRPRHDRLETAQPAPERNYVGGLFGLPQALNVIQAGHTFSFLGECTRFFLVFSFYVCSCSSCSCSCCCALLAILLKIDTSCIPFGYAALLSFAPTTVSTPLPSCGTPSTRKRRVVFPEICRGQNHTQLIWTLLNNIDQHGGRVEIPNVNNKTEPGELRATIVYFPRFSYLTQLRG